MSPWPGQFRGPAKRHSDDAAVTQQGPLDVGLEVVWDSPEPDEDDLCRTATEEAVRGFENTDPLFGSKA